MSCMASRIAGSSNVFSKISSGWHKNCRSSALQALSEGNSTDKAIVTRKAFHIIAASCLLSQNPKRYPKPPSGMLPEGGFGYRLGFWGVYSSVKWKINNPLTLDVTCQTYAIHGHISLCLDSSCVMIWVRNSHVVYLDTPTPGPARYPIIFPLHSIFNQRHAAS